MEPNNTQWYLFKKKKKTQFYTVCLEEDSRAFDTDMASRIWSAEPFLLESTNVISISDPVYAFMYFSIYTTNKDEANAWLTCLQNPPFADKSKPLVMSLEL